MSDSIFTYDAATWSVTPAMKEAFDKNGFILVRNILTQAEVTKLRSAVDNSCGVRRHAYNHATDGTTSRMCVWNHPGDDVTGVLVRTPRVVDTFEQLMGGDEVYHYHSKLMMKDAHTGGPWHWHQDYGYWYYNGCLYPDMGTVFIPVDDCTKENGCLQVLVGSHKFGRVQHLKNEKLLKVEPERVQEAKKRLQHMYIEMKAGDMLFFHCNLFHCSEANTSDHRRWVFLVAFNKRSNDPYMEHHHPQYTPLKKVKDEDLVKCEVVEQLEGKWFMYPEEELNYNVH